MKIVLTFLCMLLVAFSFGQVVLTSSDLPIIKINTGKAEIPNEPKIPATMEIINNNGARNNVTDAANEYSGNIGIEVRGESSQGFPMKSYSIELRDANGDDMDKPVFGMQAESDWVLYAPYTDKTLLRNALAYQLSNAMGHWAAHTKFVEVLLNGEYIGIYVFLERIKRKRVNIKKLEAPDSTGDKVTGGYIFAIDKNADAWYSSYTTPNSNAAIHFKYVYPKTEDIIDTQKNYIKSYVDSFENALAATNFANPQTGFRKFADDRSFIDYLIVNEVSRNVDGYRISTFLTKDRNSVNPKIKAGPVWDYDIAFRNADYCNGSDVSGWAYNFNNVCAADGAQVPFWWTRFMEDPLFQSDLLCRWVDLRQTVLSERAIYAFIDSVATLTGEARERHFTRWPVLGVYVWPNPQPIPADYNEEISILKTWISTRLAWIDDNITKTGQCAVPLAVDEFNLKVIARQNDARLTWQSAATGNNDYFIAERSPDGISFTAFARVKSTRGNGAAVDYMLDDIGIDRFHVPKIYYRLRSVGRTGEIKISNIAVLNAPKNASVLTISPNPVHGRCNIRLQVENYGVVKMIVFNGIGEQLVTTAKNIIAGTNEINLNTSGWAHGIYVVLVITERGENITARFVK